MHIAENKQEMLSMRIDAIPFFFLDRKLKIKLMMECQLYFFFRLYHLINSDNNRRLGCNNVWSETKQQILLLEI